MSIALSHEGGCCRIEFDGAIDISCAEDLKATLVQALETSQEICVCLAGTTELDVTAVQLLWAAARDAEQRRLGFIVNQPPELYRSLADAGLVLPASRSCEASRSDCAVAG